MVVRVNLVFTFLAYLLFQCTSPVEKERRFLIIAGAQQLQSYDTFIQSIREFAGPHEFQVDLTGHRGYLSEDTLRQISVAILLVDPSDLTWQEQRNLERFGQSGGGLIMLQKEVNKYSWPWYHQHTRITDHDPIIEAGMHTTAKENKVLLIDSTFTSLSGDQIAHQLERLVGSNTWDPAGVTLPPAPDPSRFTHLVLDDDINEPMELSVLPTGKVLFIEREGAIKLYNPQSKSTKTLAILDVNTQGNYEDGLLGLTIDPQYHKNNWIYLYYSPVGDKPVQHLSRFRLAYEDTLLLATEKVILEVDVQRETCCHSAGSLVFGPGGLLFISTGDNTSSKESDGFSPLDERPGRSPFDAQKSSGNTHDLRGKILRIEVQPDGTYKIPEGNLFPKDGSLGRPEIYVMGCRNPFRFSIDARSGYLYWGDVGPDGGQDGPQGPQSYDEWNQARRPGNFGWPYFVGDNKAYAQLDFATGEIGPLYDPEHPVNDSPNNTGLRDLPPAQLPMLWYGYSSSQHWPMLGTGSRSAMAGPVYYKPAGSSTVAFPDYYNGKLFIYEWARSWIKVLSFDDQGNFNKIEPFLPEIEISKPIDIEFGPDGAMYILAYGANYFANNEDAQLIKIEFAEGNRVPVPRIVASQTVGTVPLDVSFSAGASYDYDSGDSLTFKWVINDSISLSGETIKFIFMQPGTNKISLRAYDTNGDSATALINVKSGNDLPKVAIDFQGNQSFYFDQRPNRYQVEVKDAEDGSTTDNTIAGSQVVVNFNYLAQGEDLALLGPGLFQKPTRFLDGRRLMDASDCATCHDYQLASRGPSYQAIAERYFKDPQSAAMLAQKIVQGGGGNWGSTLMAAHPQHTEQETYKMAQYILSLAPEADKGGLPLQGDIITSEHLEQSGRGKYLFTAYYQDRGAPGADNLAAYQTMILRHPQVEAESYDDFKEVDRQRPDGGTLEYVGVSEPGSFISFRDIDLKGITDLTYRVKAHRPTKIVVRLDQTDGPVWSHLDVTPGNSREWQEITVPVDTDQGKHKLYFMFEGSDGDQPRLDLDFILFEAKGGAAL